MQPFGPGVNLDKKILKLHLDLCTNEISLKTWWGRNFEKRKCPYSFQNKGN